MTKEEIFSHIENFCQKNGLQNDKLPDAKVKGNHFFKEGNLYWAWYGEACKGKLRIDFVACPKESVRKEKYASIRKMLNNRDYDIVEMKAALHIFFVHDIELESVSTDILDNAMRKYQKFMNEDFDEIKGLLEK